MWDGSNRRRAIRLQISNPSGQYAVYRKNASGEGKEELLFQAAGRQAGPESWSKDGAWRFIRRGR